MLLPHEDAQQYVSLYQSLLTFAAAKLGGVAGVKDLAGFRDAGPAEKGQVRDSLLDHPELIDAYSDEMAHGLTVEDRESILPGWKKAVRGTFVVLRDLKRYTVFLPTSKESPVAYGVVGVTTEIADMVQLPAVVDAVLLPWKGLIVSDGFMRSHAITFGPGFRTKLNGVYRGLRAEGRIVTSLDVVAPPVPAPRGGKRKPPIQPPIQRQKPDSPTKAAFTKTQGQYLAFIALYTKLHRRAPAEADIQKYFRVTPPTVHQMILTLDRLGLISRVPGGQRSVRVLVPPGALPSLD